MDTITRETCDRCGPAVAAVVTVNVYGSGDLNFCAHCYRANAHVGILQLTAVLTPFDDDGFVVDTARQPEEAPEQVVPRHSRPATADPNYPL